MSPRSETPNPRMRRVYLLRRALVLLDLFALGALAFYIGLSGTLVGGTENGPKQIEPLRVVEWQVEGRNVEVAAYIPQGTFEGDAQRSILKIYEWSQEYHFPVQCGSGNEEDCAVGSTTIVILSSSRVRLVNGQMSEAYVTTGQMVLNQFLISQLLASPPQNFEDLITWHSFAETLSAGSFQQLSGEPFLDLSSVQPVESVEQGS